jgi:hypothetical protein
MTFWYQRIFPGFWFGFLILWTMLATIPSGRDRPPVIVFLIPVFMAFYGYFLMRWLVFPLADEVFLDQGEVIVRKGGKEIRFGVTHIINVNSSIMINPERITLTLREESELGREIVFCPKHRFHLFRVHPIAEELISKANGLPWIVR